MKKLLCLLAICLSVSVATADEFASIAKIDFNEIKDLLLDVAFANPQNKEFQEKHLASKKKHDDMMKKIMESQRDGKPIDPYEMAGSMTDLTGTKAIENLARAELILIIEKLYKDQYQLVISKTHQDPVLYTTSPIPDLTSSIKQYLLKEKATQ
ncbi:MAG: hypothetical protein V3V05_05305 [Pontiella sp.]